MGSATLLIVLLALTGLPGASVGAAIVLEAGLGNDARLASRELRTLSEQLSRVARRLTGRAIEAAAAPSTEDAAVPMGQGVLPSGDADLDAIARPSAWLTFGLIDLPPPSLV